VQPDKKWRTPLGQRRERQPQLQMSSSHPNSRAKAQPSSKPRSPAPRVRPAESSASKLASRTVTNAEGRRPAQTPPPRGSSTSSRLRATTDSKAGQPDHVLPEVIPLIVSDARGRQLEAIYGSRLKIERGLKPEKEAARITGREVHTAFSDSLRTDRFKDTGYWYLYSSELTKVTRYPEVEAALPWRYRVSGSYIRLRQHPTPRSLPANLLGSWIDPSISEKLKAGLMKRFGGRCQACGALNTNASGRQTAPELLVTWEHVPHLNASQKVGMRIMKGVAGVCSTCYASAHLTGLRHELTQNDWKAEASKDAEGIGALVKRYIAQSASLIGATRTATNHVSAGPHTRASAPLTYDVAIRNPLLWLGSHNRWPLSKPAHFERIGHWLQSTIRSAGELDDYEWFVDVSWLYQPGLLAKGVEVPIHHRQKARVKQPRPGILAFSRPTSKKKP